MSPDAMKESRHFAFELREQFGWDENFEALATNRPTFAIIDGGDKR
jgi:hypothetical protein